jgi:hypothetical protein
MENSMPVTVIENGIENGVRWVELSGVDNGTGIEFINDTFGIQQIHCLQDNGQWTDSNRVLDCDGCPLTDSDDETIAVKNSTNA